MIDHLKRLATELIGTLSLCLIAILAMSGTAQGDAGRLAAAGAYGLGVLGVMTFFGTARPVHLNPAVTLAIYATGRGSLVRVLACISGQLLGGCLAGLVTLWLLAGEGTAMGAPIGIFTKTDSLKTVVIEGFLTLIWAGAFLACMFGGKSSDAVPLRLGLTVTGAALAGLPFTGAAMNPARALASAIATLDFGTLWLFVAGPLAGGALAGLIGRILLPEIPARSRPLA